MTEKAEHPSVSLPDQKNYDVSYGLAVKLVGEKLRSFDNLDEQCRRSESVCRISGSARSILVKYLNSNYQVSWPDIEITLENSHSQVELRDKILILDYLVKAKGTPLSGTPIAFQELSGVSPYLPSFSNRAVKPLITYFGNSPEGLLNAAAYLGGMKTGYGDISVTIPAFNRVPITLVIWKGDEEFPANANILFDNTIMDYLSAEDIIVLCQTIVWKLIKVMQ